MNPKLFTVSDRFYIKPGNGTAVVGEHQLTLPIFKVKDNIVLIRPDGTEITMEVGGFETFQTVNGNKKIAILIENITKEDVPVGTDVFLKYDCSIAHKL